MQGGVDMCVCTRDSDFIPVVLLICCAVALLCLVCHTHSNEGGERICILLESSQVTVYLRPDHCCYRSRVIRMETDMETWLVRFIYRTPSRKKGTVMDSTAPIYLVWNLIEDSPKWEYTPPTFHSSCTLRISRFYSYVAIQATSINQWVQSRHGLPTARPLLLSLRGHSRGDRQETWLVRFPYRTSSKNKWSVSRPPIYIGGNLIEETLSARTHYPRSSRCVPCEPHGSAQHNRPLGLIYLWDVTTRESDATHSCECQDSSTSKLISSFSVASCAISCVTNIYSISYILIYFVCEHTHTHKLIYTYAHTHTYARTHSHTHTHTCVCVYIFMYLSIFAYVHI